MPADLDQLVAHARRLADRRAPDVLSQELAELALQAAGELGRLRAALAQGREYARRQEQTALEQGLEGQARTFRHLQTLLEADNAP